MDLDHPDYQSFLLRVWRGKTDEPWRGSLHSTSTNAVCQFATLEELYECLDEQLETLGGTPPLQHPQPIRPDTDQ